MKDAVRDGPAADTRNGIRGSTPLLVRGDVAQLILRK